MGKWHGKFMIGLLILALFATLTGCGNSNRNGVSSPAASLAESSPSAGASASGSTEAAGSKKSVELKVWTDNPSYKEGWDAVGKAFTEQNPGITVAFTHYPSDQYTTVLRTAIQGGTAPDLFRTNGFNALGQYVDMNAALELDGKVDTSAFDPSFMAASIINGKVYATPGFSKDVLAVYYNKDIFDKNGISIPKSYDEFLAACEKLKAAGTIPVAYGGKDTVNNIFAAYTIAPSIVTPQWYEDAMTGASSFKDSKFVKAVSIIKELADKGYYGKLFQGVSFDAAKLSFQQGKAAMIFDGSWDNSSIKTAPNLKYGAFYFPPLKAGDPVVGAANNESGLTIYAKTKAEEAAVKFAKFVSSPDFYRIFDAKLSLISPLKDLKADDPIFNDFNSANQWMTFYFVHFNKHEPTPQTYLMNGLQAVFAGKKTIDQLIDDIQGQVDKDFPELKK
ncbi:ABC transporter substrate-binding protein [Cohnella nanjingensis]|uniref:Extracellular solute-binding protein n=1 Tax=Cohnella nanjingensis TaxID=1387779 RepID=A0A7X0RUB6_9BACL|nr:extracellular solute-binding protein [Cohnella nanjingensis]MBB6672259.1 extracellular solute-binding protein [Cohnella nanjingensis]